LDFLWHAGPLGRLTLDSEAHLLAQSLDDVFGPWLLQLGQWGAERELLGRTRARRYTVVAPAPGRSADVAARLSQLPVAAGAVDAVLLPHCLEFEDDPHAVLREADRVLGGEGQLIVLGFRPASPWGWRAAASRDGFPPGLRRLLSESRLREWLVLLGYEIVQVRHYLYTLPMGSQSTASGQISVRRGWVYPLPAGAYLLKARKRLFGATPLRLRRRERRGLLGGALEPSA
jgi:SAM-dependent methyltransferase